MAVKITKSCIACDACLDDCPVGAIVDHFDNPTGEKSYFVHEDICVECVDHNKGPACAHACPVPDCIVWSDVVQEMPKHPERKPNGVSVIKFY